MRLVIGGGMGVLGGGGVWEGLLGVEGVVGREIRRV